MDVLVIEGLSTRFVGDGVEVVAVDDVDLVVKERQTVGLVGESGSGKSTIANSILGILPETGRMPSGVIRFKGVDLRGLGEREMQHEIRGKQISMIFQDPMVSLNPLFTVGAQVVDVLRLHQNLGTQEARAKAVELFKKVGISDPEKRFHSYPHELSGGMIQRVVIAMAMSCQPSLIIADEPTTALDVTIQNQILNEFEKLVREAGVSVLWIAHDLGVIRRVSDYVYVMYAGTILERGNGEDVFRNPLHPYTEGLLRSNPIYHKPKSQIPTIRGELSQMPTKGCRFYPRCTMADGECVEGDIGWVRFEGDHWVRCRKTEARGNSRE
ncbi:MAG: ABC transporter ATP-binding protein [Deltaproteobacteria bacterium]|nr:ABC transporter ATP-binding protein [Deltaproteobacteria bacterium]